MSRIVNLKWGSEKFGLPVQELALSVPTTLAEALDGSCDVRFADQDAVVFQSTGQGAFVFLRAAAIDSYLKEEYEEGDIPLDDWDVESIREFVRQTPVPGQRQKSRKPKPTPIKASKVAKMSRKEMEEYIRTAGLVEEDDVEEEDEE